MRIITIIEKLKRNEQGNNLFVVFIENGKITMQGSPVELQKTNEHYRALKMADEGI